MTATTPGLPRPAGPGPLPGVVTAGPADTDALSHLIAHAFFALPPSRWLIPGPAARRAIFPAYFRIYVEHALATGIVHTTPDRTAAALWLPTGTGLPGPPPGYGQRLAAVTGPHPTRFATFDATLERHHPTGTAHHHLAMLAVAPGISATAPAACCCAPTTPPSTMSPSRLSWKPPPCAPAASTSDTATPSGRTRRSASPAAAR
jgi:hypothetical protein